MSYQLFTLIACTLLLPPGPCTQASQQLQAAKASAEAEKKAAVEATRAVAVEEQGAAIAAAVAAAEVEAERRLEVLRREKAQAVADAVDKVTRERSQERSQTQAEIKRAVAAAEKVLQEQQAAEITRVESEKNEALRYQTSKWQNTLKECMEVCTVPLSCWLLARPPCCSL